VAVEPLAPTRTTKRPFGACSRAVSRHPAARLPACTRGGRRTDTLVRICGVGASRWTAGARARLPSTSSTGGRFSCEQPAPTRTVA